MVVASEFSVVFTTPSALEGVQRLRHRKWCRAREAKGLCPTAGDSWRVLLRGLGGAQGQKS